MKQKIILLDVDGTLVTYENQLPESAVKAVRQAREKGHKVYICTGRSEAEVYDYIWAIGLDGMIGGNGTFVKSGDTVIKDQHITSNQEKHIVDWLNERNLPFYLEANSGLYASENFETGATDAIKQYSSRKGKGELSVREVFPEMIYGADLYRDDINKVSFVLSTYQDHLDSVAEFPDLKAGTWGGAGETALFGDLGIKNIDKANAIDALVNHLGASIDDTIAFGDAKIDVPMLEHCNIGVAMGNAGQECKDAADYITDDVEQDGLYKAFQHFGIIE